MTLSMRVRNSAYAFWHTTDIPTDIYIPREISIEHPSVGLASLALTLHIASTTRLRLQVSIGEFVISGAISTRDPVLY